MNTASVKTDFVRELQQQAFQYFIDMIQPKTGLVADNSHDDPSTANITAVGLALAVYIVGVERGYITREKAVEYTLTLLRFFWNSPQSQAADATGYKGFYYRFLDTKTGRRTKDSELSTVDSAYLLAGILTSAVYFDDENADETEIRTLADKLYRRVDWVWALNSGETLTHGWKPEEGFIEHRWEGYSEGIIIYLLALGSPTFPLTLKNYEAWLKCYEWETLYDYQLVNSKPLFVHQLPHCWVDFRGIQDAFMREKQSDYFENSRHATYVQQAYAIRNPERFEGYGPYFWGFTATDGPGDVTCIVSAIPRTFFGYEARSVPNGPDDGTVSPCAVLASLPFAPEIVLPTLQHMIENYPEVTSKYGFKCSINPTYPTEKETEDHWISECHYALDQGPIVLMVENYLSGLIWKLMQRSSYLVTGLKRSGFTGGWLEKIED